MNCKTESSLQAVRWHWLRLKPRLQFTTQIGLLYKAAILDAVAEMQAIGEWDISPDAFAVRFDDMLRELAAAKDPATAPPGVLAYEDFWLMDKDIWIGLLTLHPHINEQFLHSGGHIGYMDGAGCPAQAARTASVSNPNRLRPRWAHVARTLSMRSTNRLPSALCVP